MGTILQFVSGIMVVIVLLLLAYYFAPKGWRTAVFNVLGVAIPVAAGFFDMLANVNLEQYLDKDMAMGIGLGVCVANIFLRAVTTTPLGQK